MERLQEHVARLVTLVTEATPSLLDCAGHIHELAMIAESELAAAPLPVSLHGLRAHLRDCDDCREEYGLLLDSLQEIQIASSPL
jgi:hypothetical protein